jgi:hypothetical protein
MGIISWLRKNQLQNLLFWLSFKKLSDEKKQKYYPLLGFSTKKFFLSKTEWNEKKTTHANVHLQVNETAQAVKE